MVVQRYFMAITVTWMEGVLVNQEYDFTAAVTTNYNKCPFKISYKNKLYEDNNTEQVNR